jgi:acylphosphatase
VTLTNGFVRVLPSDEVVAEGDAAALDAFVDSLRRGNRISEVRDVEVEWSTPHGGGGDFVVGD